MAVFQKYANYYDILYRDKNYKKEVEFLEKVINRYSSLKVKNILSLGCGTANHDLILAGKSYKILGIDSSEKMLEIAREKAKKQNLDIKFKLGNIKDFKVNREFDLAIAMFNVMGYIVRNKDIEKALQNISRFLRKNALFVFDCWYGPAVLKDRPRKEKDDKGEIVRTTVPKLDIENSIIDINFRVFRKERDKKKKIAQEIHRVRFWYLPELKYFLSTNGFDLIKSCNFMNLNSKVSENNWNIFIIAKKL